MMNEKKPGYVYIVAGDKPGYYKVGKTTNPVAARLKQHHTAAPSLKIHKAFPASNPSGLEAVIKNHFESQRDPGTTEWFWLSELDLVEIERLTGVYERHWALEADVVRFRQTMSLPDYISPDASDEELVQELRQAEQEVARAIFKAEMLRHQVKIRIGAHAGLRGLAGWESSCVTRLDQAALKAEQPTIWERFRRELWVRKFRLL